MDLDQASEAVAELFTKSLGVTVWILNLDGWFHVNGSEGAKMDHLGYTWDVFFKEVSFPDFEVVFPDFLFGP